ncbi:PAS domain-containing protein, partial [Hydrogenophaga sp.]|uniref:PAS domain-containing protein n=1 Tax=Hydrogenophaga sp. TaxID=1904254 RepID=UPI002FC90399
MIPWELLPGLGAALGPEAALLEASPTFKALHASRGRTEDWTALLSESSRLELISNLHRQEDFQATLHLIETSRPDGSMPPMWLTCKGHWMPAFGHHACYFADTTGIELDRMKALTLVERIHLIFKHLPVMVAHFGPRPLNQCAFANQRFAELFGFDEQTIVGVPALDLIGESLREVVVPFLRRALKGQVPVTFPCEINSATGDLLRLEVTVTPAADPQSKGTDQGFFYLITNITERHKTEFALRESEDRLSRFMNASEEGVVFHRDGLMTDANPAASRLFETPLHMLLGRSVLELVPPEYRARAASVIASGADASYESEVFNVHGER